MTNDIDPAGLVEMAEDIVRMSAYNSPVCPAWCKVPAPHQWEGVDANGTLWCEHLSNPHPTAAWVTQIACSRDGVASLDDVGITVDVEPSLADLPPERARAIAQELEAAAAVMDAIEAGTQR